jgi:hypothetical protein
MKVTTNNEFAFEARFNYCVVTWKSPRDGEITERVVNA